MSWNPPPIPNLITWTQFNDDAVLKKKKKARKKKKKEEDNLKHTPMERCGKQEAVVITKFDLKHADDVYLCALRARLRLIV